LGDRYGVSGQVLGGYHMHDLRRLRLCLRLLLSSALLLDFVNLWEIKEKVN